MRLLKRLFGAQAPAQGHDPALKQALPPHDAIDPQPMETQVHVSEYTDRFASIDQLGLHGTKTQSPDGRFTVVTGSVMRRGENYDSRIFDGGYAMLEGRILRASGDAQRPHDGKVANNGAFVVNDWLHWDGLTGRFLAFRPDGSNAITHDFTANIACNGISADGRFAACQTLRSPDSPDSCVVALFDVDAGVLVSQIQPECTTAKSFEFDMVALHLHVLTNDGDREIYCHDGQMVDRPAWTDRRIARGDLRIIGELANGPDISRDDDLVAKLLAGLRAAQNGSEPWGGARARRLEGELHQLLGHPVKALAAYEAALLLDPQVGVARKAEKLRRTLHSVPDAPKARRNRFEQQADRLGIRHEAISLETGGRKQWRWRDTDPYSGVEDAALARYVDEGWEGAAAEGGLVLTLIKAASFRPVAIRNADTFIEALYAQNVAFDEDRFSPEQMVSTIEAADIEQLRSNWQVITATAGSTPAFYPKVFWPHVGGLFAALGANRLAQIASIFATASYDLRAGWPDLTLWRGGEVRFVEVKAPTDQMHATQTRLISTLLKPLNFDVSLAEIRVRIGP